MCKIYETTIQISSWGSAGPKEQERIALEWFQLFGPIRNHIVGY